MFAKAQRQTAFTTVIHILGMVALSLIAMASSVSAQTACPNASVHGTTSQNWQYAYQNANRAGASCSRQVGIPANGARIFASRADCRSGTFHIVAEENGGILADSLTCTNCTSNTRRDLRIAPNSSADITAYFTHRDGEIARYTGTISRGPADANGRTLCSITNASWSSTSYGGDAVRPTARLGALAGPAAGTYSVAITLSEPSTNFTVADLSLVNAAATLAGAGANYVATLTPSANGAVRVSVAANTFTDASGNANTASNEASATFDGTVPGVQISGLPQSFMGRQALSATITFSENITGFTASDLSVENASVTSLSGSGTAYTISLLTTGNGDVSLHLPANRVVNSAGNGNAASNVATSSNLTIAETQKQIAQFIAARANQLISNQPGLICFMSGGCGGGSFNFDAAPGQATFSTKSRDGSPVWFRLNGSRSRSGTADADYVFGAFGAHRSLGRNALLGFTLEIDHQSQRDGVAKLSGTGWLAGPYIVGRFPNQPLFYEARALWGKTNNKVSPFGTYTDDFQTERFLLQAKIAGTVNYGKTTLTPSLSGAYTQDTQLAYTDSLGNMIPQQGVKLGQMALGLDFNTPVDLNGNVWNIGGGVSAIYSKTQGVGAAAAVVTPYDGGRARVHLSASRQLRNGGAITLGAFYDGIGTKDYESYGVEAAFKVDF